MARHGLGGTDGELLRMVAEGAFDRDGFSRIAERRRRSVRVDVTDLLGIDLRVAEGIANYGEGALAARGRGRDVVRTAAHAITDDLPQNGCAAALRQFQ